MKEIKTWGAAVAGISAIIGLIFGAIKLYEELGLPMLATQDHVERKIAPVVSTMQGMRADINRNSLADANQRYEQIGNSIAQWKLELSRAATDDSRMLAQQRIEELEVQRSEIGRRIKDIERELYGAH
jgi:chromosome segregation ATPase